MYVVYLYIVFPSNSPLNVLLEVNYITSSEDYTPFSVTGITPACPQNLALISYRNCIICSSSACILSHQSGDSLLCEQTAVRRVSELEGKQSDAGGEVSHDGLLFFGSLGFVEVLCDGLASGQG